LTRQRGFESEEASSTRAENRFIVHRGVGGDIRLPSHDIRNSISLTIPAGARIICRPIKRCASLSAASKSWHPCEPAQRVRAQSRSRIRSNVDRMR
jgi:hypothetical protein